MVLCGMSRGTRWNGARLMTKLVLKPDVYPCSFVIWGGSKDYGGFVDAMVEQGASVKEIEEQVADLKTCENTAGFRLNLGIVQGIFVKEALKWSTVDTYAHEAYHAVVGAVEYLGLEGQEAGAYLMDYLIREITKSKIK